MKLLRLSLILLLAVLLPVRGALAGAMLCAPAMPAQAPAPMVATDHHPGHVAAQAHDAHNAHDGQDRHGAHGKADATHQACTPCAAFCSLMQLADTGHPLVTAAALPAASFPPLAAAAAHFERDGPERPPRSI